MAAYVSEFKLFSAGLIWVLALVGGFGPLLLLRKTGDATNSSESSKRNAALVTSVLNMFAGGIFLSGACLHLLPDAQENAALATWLCESESGCFKWANFFFGVGFLLVLLMEVFAHSLQHLLGDGHRHDETTNRIQELSPLVAHDEVYHRQQQQHDHELNIRDHHRRHESCSSEETDASSSPHRLSYSKDEPQGAAVHSHSHHDHDVETGSHSHSSLYGSTASSATSKTSARTASRQLLAAAAPASIDKQFVDLEVTHTHVHGLMDPKPILALVVFLALSFHSVMEGMGIGASSHAAWDILVAVLAHKSLAAFALTQELLQHRVPRRRVLSSIAVFSLMTPVGILLGWLIVDTTTESMGSGVCSALAGGTFLFVAVMEVIPQELQNQKQLVPKCGALLAGYCAMGVLSIWA